MSYRIDYDSRAGKYEIRKDRDWFPYIMTVFCILGLLIYCSWPEGKSRLKEILIPGENTVTIQAFSAMTDDLRCGASMLDAVEVFCKTVIHGE